MELRKWYKLDNAAKVFPSVSTEKRSNVFSLSANLKERIDPLILQKALELTIKRFPTLNVQLRKGMFWYYLEANDNYPRIAEEGPFMLKHFASYRGEYGFLFRVLYYEKRITLEMFHSLTDGTGALEFLKSLIYTYLNLKDAKLPENVDILTEKMELLKEEERDSFAENFMEKVKGPRNEVRALKFKSPLYKDNWVAFIVGYIPLDQIKEASKKYKATITEYISALLISAAYRSKQIFEDKDKPFSILVPVNLRKFFPSRSLRNFSLFVNINADLKKDLSFEEIIENVKLNMAAELQKEKLQVHVANNVRAERNFFLRIAPRFIKEFALKLAYLALGDKVLSVSFSNLGMVKIPQEMEEHVESFTFTPGGGHSSPLNLGVVSYRNTLAISFVTAIQSRLFEKEFFTLLTSQGIKVEIDHNDLEV